MDYIVETCFEGPNFVAVPNHVAQNSALSADALGVLVYLGSLPRGFLARVSSIQARFKIGKDKWQRIARELREAGAMIVEAVRGVGGRVVGKRVRVCWPRPAHETESRVSRPSDRKPEKPTVGKSAKVSRKTRQSEPENPAPYKEKEKQTGSRKAAPERRKAKPHRLPLESGGAAVPSWDDLGKFQRAYVRAGNPVPVPGVGTVRPDHPAYALWQAAHLQERQA